MKKAIITRTINSTNVTLIGMDIITGSVTQKKVLISGTIENTEKTLKELRKMYETDTFKIAMIGDTEVVSQMYAMYEEDFIKYGKPVNNRFDSLD